jgi:Ca2+-binding EF-hand superfamily protein
VFAIDKFKRSVNKVKMMGAMDSLPLHYFKEHSKYTGKDKLAKSDRMRQQRILESLHGQFHSMLEDVEFLHRCFTLLDGDDDGRLTAAELKRWISLLNEGDPTNEELKDALDMMPGKGGVEIDGEVVLADPEVGVEFEDFLGVRLHHVLAAASAVDHALDCCSHSHCSGPSRLCKTTTWGWERHTYG